MPQRALFLALCFAILGAVLVGRLFQLQVVSGEHYARAVDESRRGVEYIHARRGRILDRHGTVLVDNRSVYDLAVVMADLELTGRERHRLDFHAFDEAALDAWVADLATRCALPSAAVREEIEAVFATHPGIARRSRLRAEETAAAVLLIPQAVFIAEEEQPTSVTDLGSLYESGLLHADPRSAISRELEARWGPGTVVLEIADLRLIAAELATLWGAQTAMVHSVIEPFVDRIGLAVDEEPLLDTMDQPLEWLLVTPQRRDQMEQALTRFLGHDQTAIGERLREVLGRPRPAREFLARYLIPLAAVEDTPEVVPTAVPIERAEITGSFAGHERVWLVQGELEEEPGILSQVARRVAAGLEMPASEVARLLRNHAEPTPITRAERAYRVWMIVFDTERLSALVSGLAAVYRSAGVEAGVFDIEAALAGARQLADREWAGSTRYDPIPIKRDVYRQLAIDLAGSGVGVPEEVIGEFGDYRSDIPPLPGLRIVSRVGREYRFSGSASHIIGWLGKISATTDRRLALALGLDPEGWTGTRGIEAVYDDLLQGVSGRTVRLRTPEGWKALAHQAREPTPGQDIRLTIDNELQLATEDALANWFELSVEAGAIPKHRREQAQAARAVGRDRTGMVVLDVRSGAVLAMASTPGFDLADVRDQYAELVDPRQRPDRPMHDNATMSNAYPGSTMKPLVAMAALCDGKIRPGERIHTEGYVATWGGRQLMRDHPVVPRNWSLSEAITESSNSYFATVAERVGPERMTDWYRRFGIGVKQSVDIDWQRPGPLPTPGNIARLRPTDPGWHPHDTWSLGIGQRGFASPLQIGVVAAAVASGGTIYKPYLWEGARGAAVAEQLAIPAAGLREIQRGMAAVTEPGGTASQLELGNGFEHIEVAAKTGTAEWQLRGEKMPNHAWLMGYAPADDPEVAFALYVHAAGIYGGQACTGPAKKVLETWFEISRRESGSTGGD